MTRTDYDYEPNTATASTPAQIADRRRAAVKPEVDAFVERIEAGLLTSPSNANGEHWFSVGRVSRDAVDGVIARYSAAGWDARHEHDPRDGDAIVLRPAGGDGR